MGLLLGCLAAHHLAAMAVPSPWGVPDLTVIGLVLAIVKQPQRWLSLSAIAGIFMMAWAIRFPVPVFLGAVGYGWLAWRTTRQWDLTDRRVVGAVVGITSALSTFGLLWLHELWSPPLVGLAALRVAVTTLCVPAVRLLAKV